MPFKAFQDIYQREHHESQRPTHFDPSPVPAVASVSYSEYTYREGEDIEISLRADVTGVPTVVELPDFLEEEGTYLLGTMPAGEEAEFTVTLKAEV